MLLRSSQVGGGRTACPQFAVGDPFQLEIDDYFTIGLNACGPPVVGFKGVMRGVKEDTITPGAEKSQQCHKYFLQCSTFTSERSQVRTWGRQTCFLPRAPSNLVTPLVGLTTGSELGGPLPPQNFSGLFLKVLHRPLTAPLVAKLARPVVPLK